MRLDQNQQQTLLALASTERTLAAVGGRVPATPERQDVDRLQRELKEMRDAAASAQMAVDDMENEIDRKSVV